MSKRFWIATGFMAVVMVGLVTWNVMEAWAYRFQGAEIIPAAKVPLFSLTDQVGEVFRISDQQGKLVLLTFGYTTCPDVCPVTLAEFHKIRMGLGETADQILFVFVSVDPERDTPEILREHLANFDPAIIGLTGDRSQLSAVWSDYGITVEQHNEDSMAGYLVDHTARSFLIDQEGYLRLTYPFGTQPEVILDDIEYLLEGK